MKKPLDPETFSSLVGTIYDCALDPERWPEALGELRRALDFYNAALTLQAMPSGAILLNKTSGIMPDYLARMPEYASDVVDQWGGADVFKSWPLYEPAVLSRVNDPSNWRDNRYFVEWVHPQGIFDTLAVLVSRDAYSTGSIGFGRHRDSGPIGEDEVTAARLLLPHLQRAIAIGRLLDLRTLAAGTFARTLDAMSAAVVLVGPELSIVHVNAAAEKLLAAGDPIRAEGGRLSALSPATTAALAAAALQSADDEARIGRRGLGIPAPRADGSPAVLHVLPMRTGVLRPGLSSGAAAAVFVALAGALHSAPAEALAALFDLTRAEARVFARIAEGRTVTEVASDLRVGEGTVRTHLVHIYAKTGTGRQADLVRLAASLALPV